MSDLHVSLTQQEMEENGEMQFIRDHVAAAQAEDEGGAPAPVEEADTVEEQEEEQSDEPEVVEEGTEPAEIDESVQDETTDDTVWLDLDEDTERLLNEKYSGDLNEMLRAAREGQSVIGRQGNELGAVRQELEALREQLTTGLQAAQPYAPWPDEFADTPEIAAGLRVIAEQAFDRRDPETFQRAIVAWEEADPLSAGMYRDLKEMQVRQIESQAPAVEDPEATLAKMVDTVVSEFPQFQSDQFQAQVAQELEKTPSLKAVLWGQVPGVSVEERSTILREAAQRVVQRTTSETAQNARKRIAVRTSEEARQARVAAQVARGSTARETTDEPEARTVAMGETGRTLNIDRLNAMLPEGDRI